MKNVKSNKEKLLSEIERVNALIIWVKAMPDKDGIPYSFIRKWKRNILTAKTAIEDSELINDDSYSDLIESFKELNRIQLTLNLNEYR